MEFTKVDKVPGRRENNNLQALIREFVEGEQKIVKVETSEGEYKSPLVMRSVISVAVKRSGHPVKVKQRGREVYLEKI